MMARSDTQSGVQLSSLLAGIYDSSAYVDQTISGIASDSRQIKTGNLFIACAGETVDAGDFINDAINNGAIAVVREAYNESDTNVTTSRQTSNGKNIPLLAVSELSNKLGLIAHRFFGKPSDELTITAVTGTNGKSSVTHYLAQTLTFDAPCGVIGTLGYGLYPDMKVSTHTTPDVITMHQWLADFLHASAPNVAIEVSSHALVQGRTNNVNIHIAVFTNLTRDHLDYHGDMQGYADAKFSLFAQNGLQYAVINIDDKSGQEIARQIPAGPVLWRYGFSTQHNLEVTGLNLSLDHNGLSFDVVTPQGDAQITSSLLGAFNASNLLAVLCVLLIQNIPLKEAVARISTVQAIPGRMQKLSADNKPSVVIDYAHTPDALQQVLSSLRQHSNGLLWCVFGCGGNRDHGKRPLMGKIAEDLADHVVLTNDNPRSEQPLDIIKEIRRGLKNPDGIYVELDRHKAIAYALQHCCIDDVVLIAGKGHETWQVIGDNKFPFSDLEVAQAQLEKWCA